MANPIASPIFKAGPQDALATLDVYKAAGDSIINSIQALTNESGVDVAGLLGGLTGANAKLSGLLKSAKGKLSIDKGALTARLLSSVPSAVSSFKNMTQNLQAGVVGSMADLGTLQATIGGVSQTISSGNFAEVSSLGGMLGDLTTNLDAANQFKLVDKDAFSGIMSGAINEGSKLGMTNVFSTLTSGLDLGVPVTDDLLQRVVAQSLPTLVKEGDFNTLLDMSTSPVGKTMGTAMPDFSKQVIQTYQRKYTGEAEDLFGDYNKVLQTLTNVNSDWDRVKRFDGELEDEGMNLVQLLGASKDFRALVAAGISALGDSPADKRKRFHVLGGLYEETTVVASIRKFFPRVAILSDAQTRNTKSRNVMDPRAMVELAGLGASLFTS